MKIPLTVYRFLLGGVVNTSATFLLYWMLLPFVDYQLAYAISFVAGVALSYLINTKLVFKTSHSARKLITFPIVYLTTYFSGALVLKLAVLHIGIDPRFAPILSICVTVPLAYLLVRLVLTQDSVKEA